MSYNPSMEELTKRFHMPKDRSLNTASWKADLNLSSAIHGMGRSASQRRMNYYKNIPNIDYSSKGKDALSFNTDFNLFPKSQANTAEQSGDTAGPPSGEAAGAALQGFIQKLAELKASRSQPTEGTDPGRNALQGLAGDYYDPNKTLA